MWDRVERDFSGFEIWVNLETFVDEVGQETYSYIGLFRYPSAIWENFVSFRPDDDARFSEKVMAIESCITIGKRTITQRTRREM